MNATLMIPKEKKAFAMTNAKVPLAVQFNPIQTSSYKQGFCLPFRTLNVFSCWSLCERVFTFRQWDLWEKGIFVHLSPVNTIQPKHMLDCKQVSCKSRNMSM